MHIFTAFHIRTVFLFFFGKKFLLLFNKDALNWSKVMLQMIYI